MKLRTYTHFDHRISHSTAHSIAANPIEVIRHRFYPFISFTKKTRKFRRRNGSSFSEAIKERPISYACHADSAIYTYYAEELSTRYEELLRRLQLGEHVTAFRSLNRRTNVDFAFESFKWIQANSPCVAFAFDIQGFFDNLDHQYLKRAYADALGVSKLSEDHYKVFKSITKYSWVDHSQLKTSLGISKSRPWRGDRSRRICTPREFRETVVGGGLIHVNESGRGIPQGSPISAIFSNLYMLELDRTMVTYVKAISGYYRRYCDDILVVVRKDQAEQIVDMLKHSVCSVNLKLQEEKTEVCEFDFDSSNRLVASKPLQYLGFTFDGSRIHFRSSSVQKYLTQMTESVRLRARDRRKANTKAVSRHGSAKPLYTRKLRTRYSPVGKRNFVTYAYRAASRTGSPALRKQIKRLVRKFEQRLQEASNTPR